VSVMSLSLYSSSHRQSSVKAFLLSTTTKSRCIAAKDAARLKKEEGIVANFSCLDGGMIYVAEDEYFDFLCAYYVDVLSGRFPWYLSEMVIQPQNNFFRFFLELDLVFATDEHAQEFKDSLKPTSVLDRGNLVWKLMDIVAHFVSNYFADGWQKKLEFVIEVPTGDDMKSGDAFGCHVRGLNVSVNTSDMQRFVGLLVARLKHSLVEGDHFLKGSWSDFVDTNPYRKSGGMRLPFSYKTGICSQCSCMGKRVARSAQCLMCGSTGKIHVDRTYFPLYGFEYYPLTKKPCFDENDMTVLSRQCMGPAVLTMADLQPKFENMFGLQRIVLFFIISTSSSQLTTKFDDIVCGFDDKKGNAPLPRSAISIDNLWSVLPGQIPAVDGNGDFMSRIVEPAIRTHKSYKTLTVSKVTVKYFDGKIPFLFRSNTVIKGNNLLRQYEKYYNCVERVADKSGYLRLRAISKSGGGPLDCANYCHSRPASKKDTGDTGCYHKTTVVVFDMILPIGPVAKLTSRIEWYYRNLQRSIDGDDWKCPMIQGCLKFSCNSHRTSHNVCYVYPSTFQCFKMWQPFIHCYLTDRSYTFDAETKMFLKPSVDDASECVDDMMDCDLDAALESLAMLHFDDIVITQVFLPTEDENEYEDISISDSDMTALLVDIGRN